MTITIKPCIDMRFPIIMFENLTPLKLEISIYDLNVDVITRTASMFVNLKINKINEILVIHKLLNTNQLKAKQTYIERLSF